MKKILLVEDDIDIQNVYSQKLKSSGFEVILAADTDKAYHLANELIPDIILLDIMLPGKMNGLELLEKLKKEEKTKHVPVVVLTNLDTEKNSALKAGANAYLIKANTDLGEIIDLVKKFT